MKGKEEKQKIEIKDYKFESLVPPRYYLIKAIKNNEDFYFLSEYFLRDYIIKYGYDFKLGNNSGEFIKHVKSNISSVAEKMYNELAKDSSISEEELKKYKELIETKIEEALKILHDAELEDMEREAREFFLDSKTIKSHANNDILLTIFNLDKVKEYLGNLEMRNNPYDMIDVIKNVMRKNEEYIFLFAQRKRL